MLSGSVGDAKLPAYTAQRQGGCVVSRFNYKSKPDWNGNAMPSEERHVLRKDFADRLGGNS